MTKKTNLDALSLDEMWELHEEISRILSSRLTLEKRNLEKRLAQLHRDKDPRQAVATETKPERPSLERRSYPRVFPKYRNQSEPFETWSGRGKQPRWLTAALKTGRKIEEFVIKKQ